MCKPCKATGLLNCNFRFALEHAACKTKIYLQDEGQYRTREKRAIVFFSVFVQSRHWFSYDEEVY